MYSNPMQYGDDVAEVQARLNSLKYNAGVADGWFGQNTRSAVIAFQTKNSLAVDGIVGPNTWNKLFSSSALSADSITINGYVLQATFGDRVIHLNNTATLRSMMANESYATVTIAKRLKSEYRNIKGSDINISDFSMAFEILGHVYPGKIADAINNVPLIGDNIRNFIYSKIGDNIAVIDMGESSVDSNRWVWDTLANVLTSPILL
jgi:hypothetical protein